MNKKIRLCMDVILVILLVWIDQFTKKLAVDKLMNKEPFTIIKGVLEFDYLENHGVAFGMFQGQRLLILIVGAIVIACLLFLLIKMPQGRKFTMFHVIIAFIMAGGIGNIIDRTNLGYVIDFISFVLIDFPIFNVADCYVTCGVIAMCIMILFVFKEDDLEFLSFTKSKEKKD